MHKKRLLLIDGHAMAYRAYHALPPMNGPSGEPTNAVLGFANMLLKAIEDYGPEYVAATFDVGTTFRHREFKEYKATRAETPDDLRVQFARVTQLVQALSIPIYTLEDYEADDVLGSLAAQAEGLGLETIIVTGDSDTFQLTTPHVSVLTPKRTLGEVALYGPEAVRERYGLEPAQLVDYKALAGDTSDNIPGVRGIGVKTATALLQKYGSLQAIYDHIAEVTPERYRQALLDGRESAFFSQRLARIVTDLPVTLDLRAAEWGRYDRPKVVELLRELGFRSLAQRLPGASADAPTQQLGLFGEAMPQPVAAPAAPSDCSYHAVDTAEALDALVREVRSAGRVALDTETTSTDAMRTHLVGISLSTAPHCAWYVPVGHDERLRPGPQLPLDDVRRALAPVFADPAIAKFCHNAQFDLVVLAQHGMPVVGLQCDTMIAAWLLDPSGVGLGLKSLAWQRLGIEATEIESLIGAGRNQITMDAVSVARVTPYACADADMTLRLVEGLTNDLRERKQLSLLNDVEMPLVPVLIRMQMHGMSVDADYLRAMSQQFAQRLEELRSQVHALAGHPFNLNSTQQLGAVLFDELHLPVVRRTQTGYSTDAAVMEELKDKHTIVALILEHRQLEKLKGTYLDALPEMINPRTGRVHTSFKQTGASTGRLSSADPNLQNIPIRTEVGKQVRGAFIAPPGHVLLSCDYSQVELRILAHVSQDPELMGAFQRNEDVHASTAAAILGIPLAEVTSTQRGLAKAINFGLMYGMGDYGLSARTDLTVPQAREFIDAYFARFRQVKVYLDETVRLAHEQGYVETVLGRRRYFPELKTRSAQAVMRAAERAAVNMPIQGSAADILKLAMITLDRRLTERGLASAMVLQVHDELVLEVPDGELDEVRPLVVETMQNAYPLSVPLKVDAAIGKNWMEMN